MADETLRYVIVHGEARFSRTEYICGRNSRSEEADGWYIDPPAAWLALHPPIRGHAIFHTHAVGGRIDTPVFTDVGPRECGLPMLVTRTHRSNFKDAAGNIRIHTSEDRDEVIEFSEAPLPADLFVPPREFRRVRRRPDEASMSFALRMRLGWRNFKYKFRHWR